MLTFFPLIIKRKNLNKYQGDVIIFLIKNDMFAKNFHK